ncbi:MAG: NYN domain-containing protein, partial [Clostridia bacterium]|nr:NYN domain-containing protein [Clostridia bacterium]
MSEQVKKTPCSMALVAHVDAGKTTLAEAILYRAGRLRNPGRVDHGSTAMDTHALERARGITIFASEAAFQAGDRPFALLDTPGHVDFSAETERVLQVLDYAVLVISGIDGVQAHTRTLWRLLQLYRVPVLIFVTKMDFARRTADELMTELKEELGEGCVHFAAPDRDEQAAMCAEELLEQYLEEGTLSDDVLCDAVRARRVFPCFFGSGLKCTGVDEFLQALTRFTAPAVYAADFGARVYKISRDSRGDRLTHVKVTGGVLRVRDSIGEEKVGPIRLYTGGQSETVQEAPAGTVCALTGLNATTGGQGLGFERSSVAPFLEPVMRYRVVLPEEADPRRVLPLLRQLQEEDPMLKFTWDSALQQIHVTLMGEIQTEILKSIVQNRFGLDIGIDSGTVMYRETIANTVEGVGHYEPLRHYAEVHLVLEPLARGSGLRFDTRVSEDDLDRNWQRLILTHLAERAHVGVLTGSPITDVKITLGAGRAHLKHTEGGDFRQATYRAVRQGLMQAKSVLLEPYYAFRLEVPPEQIGRAINDIRARSGEFGSPEEAGALYRLTGRAPVTTLDGYAAEVAAYTGGRGRISLEVAGYDLCHNPEEVICAQAYQPEADADNPPDSVFCAHGGGFTVKWDKVPDYMHLESCLKKEVIVPAPVNARNLHISDRELEAIMLREFGPIRRRDYGAPVKYTAAPEKTAETPRKNLTIVDGYNVIFAWDELKAIADSGDLDMARTRLMDLLCGYSAYTRQEVAVVFDAYMVPGGKGERFDYQGIHVVYTKEN